MSHEAWCGDASLSRPEDECTCAITPEMQREALAAAEVLRHAAQHQVLHQVDDADRDVHGRLPGEVLVVQGSPERHQARRDDDVEAWLKRDRDALLADGADWAQLAAAVVDDLLEDYRRHADTGTPLDAEVQER